MSKVKTHLKEYFSHERVDAHEKILRKKIWSFVFAGGERKNLESILVKAVGELPSESKLIFVWCKKEIVMPNLEYLDKRQRELALDMDFKEWANNVYNQFLYEYSKINS